MPHFIEWSDTLGLGIDEIDSQHRVLVELIDEMHEAVHERHGGEVVRNVLSKIADYTKIHFAVEESLMRLLGHPAYEAHKAQHEELIRGILDIQKKMAIGMIAVGLEDTHVLKNWLTRHILESDRQYGRYFMEAGVKARLKKKSWATRLRDDLHT
jgi:hemerythrin